MKLICKLFGFILRVFTVAIEGVGHLLKTLGVVLVDTLTTVGAALGNSLFSGGIFSWLLIGGAAWFLLSSKDKKGSTDVVYSPPLQGASNGNTTASD